MFNIFLTGALYALCFPLAINSNPIFPEWLSAGLVWFAWVPGLIAINSLSPKKAFLKGYVFGLTYNTIGLWWVIIAMKKYGDLSLLLSLSILLLLVLFMALYQAVGFFIVSKYAKTPWQKVIFGTCLLSFLEWTRNYFPFQGFPYATPALALHGSDTLLQSLDVVGISGLNILIFLSNTLLAQTLIAKNKWRSFPKEWIAFALLILLTTGYGFFRKNEIYSRLIQHGHPQRVALIQGNISQDQKWLSESRDHIIETYQNMSLKAETAHNPSLVIWPEASVPYLLSKDITGLPFSTEFQNPNTGLFLGAATYEYINGKRFYLNSAFLSDASGKILSRYDKRQLVPFGEYVPFEKWISGIVPAVAGNFSRGYAPSLFTWNGLRFGTLICYESLFTRLAIDMVNHEADFIVNITNDAWFDYTSGPFQHAQFGKFRAIETRRSLVRAANTGVSYSILPTGEITQTSKLFQPEILSALVYPSQIKTFYVKTHWLIPLFLALGTLWIMIRDNKRR